ncbi:MAG: DUF1848 family protein [Deltaproteobacteria bacterium]|nr:DUF1848 family protein [Deltaproteobacteria bacterium]
MDAKQRWRADALEADAVAVSASRRTDIPALFAPWFRRRLQAGFAEYIPLGPPRLIRRSLLPTQVTHFNFWTKWPRPFFPALDDVLSVGYPVLFNVTISGLGATAVEPNVPVSQRVVDATRALARTIGRNAILWRYDPVFVSERFDAAHHRRTFSELVEKLHGSVDRVAISFVTPYQRQVGPDLRAYQAEQRDAFVDLPVSQQVQLAGELAEIARSAELELTICCNHALRSALKLKASGCNSFCWAARVYPELQRIKPPANKPCRPDCACSREVDIGVYDTCTLGCRYSYGSRNARTAHERLRHHDPLSPCLVELKR